MNRIALTGLLKIELPTHTMRFCDGGFFVHEGETYSADDSMFGSIGSVQPLSEGVGDSVPAMNITLLPPSGTAPATLSQPGYQSSRVRFWIAEFDADTGKIINSEVIFDGQVDQTVLTVGRGERSVAISVVSLAEKLFEGNIGNTLNPTWHKSVWPGEKGHDNATGLSIPVAWGTENPTSSRSSSGGGDVRGGGVFAPTNRRAY